MTRSGRTGWDDEIERNDHVPQNVRRMNAQSLGAAIRQGTLTTPEFRHHLNSRVNKLYQFAEYIKEMHRAENDHHMPQGGWDLVAAAIKQCFEELNRALTGAEKGSGVDLISALEKIDRRDERAG